MDIEKLIMTAAIIFIGALVSLAYLIYLVAPS